MAKSYPELESFELKRRKLKARDEVASDVGYAAGKSAQLPQAFNHNPRARLTMEVWHE